MTLLSGPSKSLGLKNSWRANSVTNHSVIEANIFLLTFTAILSEQLRDRCKDSVVNSCCLPSDANQRPWSIRHVRRVEAPRNNHQELFPRLTTHLDDDRRTRGVRFKQSFVEYGSSLSHEVQGSWSDRQTRHNSWHCIISKGNSPLIVKYPVKSYSSLCNLSIWPVTPSLRQSAHNRECSNTYNANINYTNQRNVDSIWRSTKIGQVF